MHFQKNDYTLQTNGRITTYIILFSMKQCSLAKNLIPVSGSALWTVKPLDLEGTVSP